MAENGIIVKAKDGTTHSFPAGMGFDEIDTRLNSYYESIGFSGPNKKSDPAQKYPDWVENTDAPIRPAQANIDVNADEITPTSQYERERRRAVFEGIDNPKQQAALQEANRQVTGFQLGQIPVVGETLRQGYEMLSPKGQSRAASAYGGLNKGVSFGFNDELVGVVEGEGARDAVRASQTAAEAANPKSFVTGELTGAVASGGGLVGGARQAGVRTTAARIGAAEGGLYGVGTADGGAGSRVAGGITGATFGAVFGKAGDAVAAKLSQYAQRGRLVVNGRFSDDAEKLILQESGVDVKTLPPEQYEGLVSEVQRGIDPAQAALYQDAQTLPAKVNLSRGQLTGDDTILRRETAALSGDERFGRRTRQSVQFQRDEQQRAVQANAQAMRQGFGGDGEAVPYGGAGDMVASRIAADASAAKDKAATVRRSATEGNATAPQAVLTRIVSDIRSDLSSQGLVKGTAIYDAVDSGFLRQADEILSRSGKGQIPVNTLSRIRQQVSRASKTAAGDARPVFKSIADNIDAKLNEAIEQSIISGDEAVIKNWQKSTKLFADYYKTYEGKKGARRFIAKMASGELDPADASKVIFGVNGITPKQGQRQLLSNIKSLVGETSPEWQALRQEGLTRILREAPDGRIGQKFSSELERQLKDNPQVMRTLYTQEEVYQLRKFSRVVRALERTAKNVGNPSGTGFMNFITSKMGPTALQIPVIKQLIEPIVNEVSDIALSSRMTRRALPEPAKN